MDVKFNRLIIQKAENGFILTLQGKGQTSFLGMATAETKKHYIAKSQEEISTMINSLAEQLVLDSEEVCDDKDNDCDDLIDEGCVEECEEPGYDQCGESSYGDCDVSIAVNYYENVPNDIKWGAVNDAWDPYVIDEYKIGWKAVDAEQMYYDCDSNEDCEWEVGCDCEELVDEGTKVT